MADFSTGYPAPDPYASLPMPSPGMPPPGSPMPLPYAPSFPPMRDPRYGRMPMPPRRPITPPGWGRRPMPMPIRQPMPSPGPVSGGPVPMPREPLPPQYANPAPSIKPPLDTSTLNTRPYASTKPVGVQPWNPTPAMNRPGFRPEPTAPNHRLSSVMGKAKQAAPVQPGNYQMEARRAPSRR